MTFFSSSRVLNMLPSHSQIPAKLTPLRQWPAVAVLSAMVLTAPASADTDDAVQDHTAQSQTVTVTVDAQALNATTTTKTTTEESERISVVDESEEKPVKPPKFYFGAGVASANLEPNVGDSNYLLDDSSALGVNFLVGYPFMKRYAAEVQLWHLGEAMLSFDNNPETVSYNGFGARGLYHYPNTDNRWSVFGGLGLSFLDTQSDIAIVQKDAFSPWLGIGAQLRMSKRWDGRVALDSFSKDASQMTFQVAYRWEKKPKPKPRPITAEQKSIDEMIAQIQQEAQMQAIGEVEGSAEQEQSLLLSKDKPSEGSDETGSPGNTNTDSNGIADATASPRQRERLVDRLRRLPRSAAPETEASTNVPQQQVVTTVAVPADKEKYAPKNADLSVLYRLGSHTLGAQSRKALDTLVGTLKAQPEKVAVIVGHTCDIGSKQLNDKLSVLRAIAVQQYLIMQGVAPQQTRTTGYGLDKPRFDNDDQQSKSQNRRVDIFIEGQSQTDKARVIQ